MPARTRRYIHPAAFLMIKNERDDPPLQPMDPKVLAEVKRAIYELYNHHGILPNELSRKVHYTILYILAKAGLHDFLCRRRRIQKLSGEAVALGHESLKEKVRDGSLSHLKQIARAIRSEFGTLRPSRAPCVSSTKSLSPTKLSLMVARELVEGRGKIA